MLIKTEQLYYLMQISKYNSLTATAKELYVNKSTLSTAIAQLEQECGFEILEKTYRCVSFTPQGKLVLEQAEQILGLMDEIYAIPGKMSSQTIEKKYTLLVEKGLMPILQYKLLTPSSCITDHYYISESKNANDAIALLDDENLAIVVKSGEEYRLLQENAQLCVKEISQSLSYPASSKHTKWIDRNKTHLTKEEFDRLPKVLLKSHESSLSIQNANNVILETENSLVAINAILNDLGVGIMADFYGELFIEKRKQLKTYAPLDDSVIHLLLVLKNSGDINRGDFLEEILKSNH